MRTINALILSSLVALFSENIFGQDFYDVNTINTIKIYFEQPDWDRILDSLYAIGEEERLIGTAVINGIKFDSVGVRYKGHSTYDLNRIKNPLNIKLDYIIKDQKLDGYGTLKLTNVYKDPSFVREVLSYEIARKYMPASKANYIKVFINDTYLGLYVNVQSVDKLFLRNHFNSDENPLIKGELTDERGQVIVWGYLGPDSTNYYNYYELKSDYGWKDLVAFLDTFNNHPEYIENVLNVDCLLWMLAFDILTVNLDSPINFGHNFYLYKDDAGRFNPIVWDLNENFGAFSMLMSQFNQQLNLTSMQQLDPFLNSNNDNYPIISKVLSNPTYRKMYIAHMKTIMEENFANGWYKERARELQSIIDAEVQADPYKFYTYEDFLNNIDETAGGSNTGGWGGRPGPRNQGIVGIAELMEGRLVFLNEHPEFQAEAPVISDIKNNPATAAPHSDVWFTAKVDNADLVMLCWRTNTVDPFEKTEMYDDGNHNDGAVNDGIYGTSLKVGSGELQYYIYAENSDAAKFSPERAEYEYYTLTIAGDVVINELLAVNDSTVPDQDGEYDDWIELYNNTDYDISLNGYFLSDDGDDLTKWTFPDTVIKAKSYLIVWADDDEEQNGLHANFKLSSSGETIYLVNSDTIIVDEVSFGEQMADIAYGRYPNGTGAFVLMEPTFSSENIEGIINNIEDKKLLSYPAGYKLHQNYPNPFNSSTTISFELPCSGKTTLKIYNINGQEIATLVDDFLPAGSYRFQWDTQNLPSGIYFYILISGSFRETKRMILLR